MTPTLGGTTATPSTLLTATRSGTPATSAVMTWPTGWISDLRSEIKAEIAEIKAELKTQKNDIASLTQTVATLAEQVRGLNNGLAQHIRESENRITDIRNDIYLGLVVLGVIFSLPAIKDFFNNRDEKKAASSQTITLEDVKRLIEEAKLGSKSSV